MFWFNGLSAECNINFELIGIVTGLAISNNVILDMQFPMALYKMLLGQNPNMDDMKEWQPEIAQSLEFIGNYKNEGTSLQDALDLNFTVERENFGEKFNEELLPNGANIPVTEENAHEYIRLLIEFTFHGSCKKQFEAFRRGFYRTLEESTIKSFFKPEELE